MADRITENAVAVLSTARALRELAKERRLMLAEEALKDLESEAARRGVAQHHWPFPGGSDRLDVEYQDGYRYFILWANASPREEIGRELARRMFG